jgi:Tol biopolymer transport system component
MKTQKEYEFVRSPIFAILFLCVLLINMGCSGYSSIQGDLRENYDKEISFEGKKLATIPEDYGSVTDVSFSSDGQKVAYRAAKVGRQIVIVNDKADRSYEQISPIALTPDGTMIVYGGERSGEAYLVINGKEVESYGYVTPGAFSPDGRLVTAVVEDKKEKDKWFIVVFDGEEEVYRSQFSDDCWWPEFSPDGGMLVYLTEQNKKRNVSFLDLSTRKIIWERTCPDCRMENFSFDSDSSRVVYIVKKKNKYFLVQHDFRLNDDRQIELPYTYVGNTILSPDGESIAYLATRDGKRFLVENHWESPLQQKETGPYEGIASMIFRPGSKEVVYYAKKQGKWRIIVGENEGPVYKGVGGTAPIFSPNGKMIAYPMKKNGNWVMVLSQSDRPDKVKEGPDFDIVGIPVFSPNGKYLAYTTGLGTTKKPRRLVIANKKGKVIKKGPIFDEVWTPVWSPDSNTVAYGARNGRELWWKVEPVE